jgi:hypothetical protein
MFLPRQRGQGQEPRVGVKGVRFKQFETAVADILSNGVRPCFHQIPPRPSDDWPWNLLPPAARVQGNGLRSVRKEQQLRSLLQCVVAMLPHDSALHHPYSIVDFGGGSGHLSIPLALLFPHCQVVVVDLKAPSLRLVHEKALRFSDTKCDEECFMYPKKTDVTEHDHTKRACRGIPNLFTYHGSMERYPDHFDLGVSLHACGEASDLVLRACARVNAQMVVAPCCVGKLNRRVLNPYVYHATGENIPTIAYPQSLAFQNIILAPEDWDAIAKAADYSDWDEMKISRNATRRTAKALLETDRLLFLQEQYQYCTALVRMDPWEASPKHDILLAWHIGCGEKADHWSPFKTFPMISDDACNADVQTAWNFLLDSHKIEADSVDWTLEEQRDVEGVLQRLIESEDSEYLFPSRMGGRKRKLIHYLAHQLGLLHWPVGYKDADKTVAVAKKR